MPSRTTTDRTDRSMRTQTHVPFTYSLRTIAIPPPPFISRFSQATEYSISKVGQSTIRTKRRASSQTSASSSPYPSPGTLPTYTIRQASTTPISSKSSRTSSMENTSAVPRSTPCTCPCEDVAMDYFSFRTRIPASEILRIERCEEEVAVDAEVETPESFMHNYDDELWRATKGVEMLADMLRIGSRERAD